MKKIALSAVAALSILSAPSFAETFLNGQSVFGRPAPAGEPASRVVDVTSAKYLNIRCGDSVTFVNGANRFSWRFDVATHRAVPLAKIAPSGFGTSALTVYVARNDMERGG